MRSACGFKCKSYYWYMYRLLVVELYVLQSIFLLPWVYIPIIPISVCAIALLCATTTNTHTHTHTYGAQSV